MLHELAHVLVVLLGRFASQGEQRMEASKEENGLTSAAAPSLCWMHLVSELTPICACVCVLSVSDFPPPKSESAVEFSTASIEFLRALPESGVDMEYKFLNNVALTHSSSAGHPNRIVRQKQIKTAVGQS